MKVLTGILPGHIDTRALTATGLFGLMVAVVLTGLAVSRPAVAATGINKTINFQGKVVNANGTNVVDGSYSFTFRLYTVSTGGTQVWTETKTLAVNDGIFVTALGDTTSLPGSVDFNTDNIYLGINFNSDGEMTPRIRFTAAPYAFNSDLLDGLDASAFAQLNPSSAQSGSLNVTGNVQAGTTLQAPAVDTATAGALAIGGTNATSVTIGKTTTPYTLQGSASSTITATDSGNTTTVGFVTPTAARAINFPNESGTVCLQNSANCGFAVGTFLAKNAQDTSSASATGALYSFTNSSTAGNRVLDLTNAGTGSTLNIAASANPGAGAALLKVNNQAGSPSGNLVDLQRGGTSVFSVAQSGAVSQTANVQSTNANSITANSLTTGAGLRVTTSNDSAANTAWSAISFNPTNAQGTTAVSTGTIAGLEVQFTQNPAVSGNTETVANLAVKQIDTSVTDNTVSSILNLANNDTATGNQVTVADAIKINGSNVTNGINFAGTFNGNLITSTNFTVSQGGAIVGVGVNSGTGLIQGTGGLTVAGATSINNNNNGATSINTGTSSGTVTIGGGSAPLVIDSTNFDVSAAGALSGITTINTSGALTVGGGGASITGAVTVNSTISGGTTYTASTAVEAPLFDTASAAALNIGTSNASSVTVGKTTAPFTIQGNASSTITATSGANTTTVGFTTPTAARTINFPNESGTICLQNSANCGFAVGTFLAKNAQDTSSASVAGTLYSFTNTNTGSSNVLSLDGAGTGSTLSVTNSGNPAAGQALILANNTNASPGGTNLLDLQAGSVSKFRVSAGGSLTLSSTVNGQTISSAANFTGTVTTASTLTVSAGGLAVTGNSTITGTLGGLTGLTVASGGASISGGLNNNTGGITNTGAVAGASTIDASGKLTLSGASGNQLAVTGAPTNSATSSLVQLGSPLVGGNAAANGGTYIGLNAPGSGAGSAADLMNLQVNDVTKFKVASSGDVTAGLINGQTISSAANFTGSVTVANGLTVSAGGMTVTGNSTITGTLGGLTGLTVASGGASISGGLNNNSGGITNAGSIAGAVNIGLTGTISGGTTYSASTAVQAPVFDTASAVALNIGTANAGALTMGQTDINFLLQGDQTSTITSTNSTGGFKTTVGFTATTGSDKTINFPNESGTVCLQNSANCGFLTGTTNDYIQNQSGSNQSADFRISGTGRANTALQAPSVDAISGGALAVGGSNATAVTVGRTTTNFTLQGASGVSGSVITATSGSNTTTLRFVDPTANRTIDFPNESGTVCLQNSANCGFLTSANVLAKNPASTETSTSSINGAQYSFINSNTGSSASVLTLSNAGAGSSLAVTTSANPGSGSAVIFASNTNASPSGNLLDLQAGSSPTSKFSVAATGSVTSAGNLTVNGTGANTFAGGITFSGVSTDITTGTNESLTIDANGTGQTILNDLVQVTQLGTADTSTLLCKNTAGQIATCSATISGSAFVQGGNSFGATAVLGTNDTNALEFETDGVTRVTIGATGGLTVNSGGINVNSGGIINAGAVSGVTTLGQSNSSTSGTNYTNATTNSGASGTNSVTAQAINLTGTNNGTGSNTTIGLSFGGVAAATNNTFYAIQFGTGFNDLIRYNGTQILSGAGKLQNAGLDSALTYSNITGVGALVNGSIASGFGTISTGNTITGTTLNGTTGVNTGAGAGTQRIDNSGNLLNIGTIAASGTVTISGAATDVTTGSNEDLTLVANGTGQIILSDTVQVSTLGTADTTTTLCRNSSNQIATCQGGGGQAFVQGGNSFGATGVLGTNDTHDLEIETDGVTRLTVGAAGGITVASGNAVTVAGGALTQSGGAVSLNNNSNNNVSINTGSSTGTVTLGGGSAPLVIDSTNFDVSSAGALSGITTISTSGAINGQTISSSANFTGTMTIQGANALTLGVTGTSTGAVLFKGATASSGTITLVGQANPTGSRTVTLPDETGVVCLQNSANCGFLTGATTDYIQNQNSSAQTTANFWISGSGRADTSILTPKLDTATGVALNIGDASSPVTTNINLNQNTTVASGKTLTVGGTALFQANATSTTAFNIKTPASGTNGNMFTVDTTNGRVGINLGSTNVPASTLEVYGTVRISGTATENFATPGSANVPTKINIPLYDPGSFGQILALGLPSSAQSTARAISMFDARTGSHQPTIGVFSPDENSLFGFSWDGSNATATLKTVDDNGSTDGVVVRSGNTVGSSGTSGAVTIQSGDGTGTNSSSGNVAVDAGSKTGTGTTGAITIGGTNASGLTLGRSGLNTTVAANLAVQGTGSNSFSGQLLVSNVATDITTGTNEDLTLLANGSGQIVLNDTTQVATLGTADTSTLLCRNSSNQIATCNVSLSGSAFVDGGNSFGQAADLGTNDTNVLNFRTDNATRLTVSATGDLTFTSGTGGFDQSASSGTFKTGTGPVTVNGDATIAANKDLTLASGDGVLTQNYSNTTGTGAVLNATNSATSGTTTVKAEGINLTGTNNGTGSNTNIGLDFGNVAAATNNTFYAINVGTGFNDLLRYNGTQLISGAGKIQNAALDSSLTYSNITGVGALVNGSIASGFGTIATGNTITGTTLNGTTGINTGASAGTQRIDASGNLVNIGNITGAGAVTIATTGSSNNLALQPAAGASLTSTVTKNAATGNEVAFDLSATVNKATSGNYTGIKLNVTETSAPGSGNLLMDLQVASASKMSVSNTGVVNVATGYQIGGAAAAGTFLRGNGTNFVGSTIQSSDLPSLSGIYLRNVPTATADNTVNPGANNAVALTVRGSSNGANPDVLDIRKSDNTLVSWFDFNGAFNTGAAIVAPTSGNTINGLVINSGALSSVTSVTASGTIQGATLNATTAIQANGTAGVAGSCAAGEARTGATYSMGILTSAGSCTTVAAGTYLAKNAADTSSAAAAGGFLYGFTNSGTGAGTGVLSLTNSNSAGTGSVLSVSSAANAASGQALILANNTNGTPSGNLIDLQVGGTSKFNVSVGGVVTLPGGQAADVTVATAAASTDGTSLKLVGGTAGSGNQNGGAVTIQGGTGTGGCASSACKGGTLNLNGGTASSTGAGGLVVISAASGGSSAASGQGAGGSITLQAGSAAGSNNNDGGSITLTAGTRTGSGTPGTVNIGSPVFTSVTQTFTQTGNNQSFDSTSDPSLLTNLNTYGTIVMNVAGAFTGATVTMPSPTNAVAGRVVYVSAASGSAAFTLAATGMSSVNMSAGNTATLVWNGSSWSGTTTASSLQQVYNNTSTSPASIITTSATKNILLQAGVGYDNANVFQIGNSAAAPVLAVDTTNTATGSNSANNGALETGTGTTGWAAYAGTGSGAISRNTTASNLASGGGSLNVSLSGTGTGGAQNDLNSTALLSSQVYLVSFNVKSSSGTPTIAVEYFRNNTSGGTLDATCSVPTNGTVSSTGFFKYTCTFTTTASGNAKSTTNFLRISKTDSGTISNIYIDNLYIGTQNTTGTQNSGNLQVGGPLSQGLTLFTLDSFAGNPFTGSSNQNLLGSMYYDTTVGRMQCYEADGWGSCGAAPNNSVELTPEYPGAVLSVGNLTTLTTPASSGNVGIMTANMCSGTSRLSINTSGPCATTDDYNYYQWTTSQTLTQSYTIIVRYQLPPTFRNFNDANTVKFAARTSSTTDGSVWASMYKTNTSGATQCGSTTDLTTSGGANTWSTVSLTGDETACGFAAGDFVTFRVDMLSKNNANVYVSNATFTMTGK